MKDRPIQILILEDNPSDAELVKRELRKAGLDVAADWVQDEAGFRAALDRSPPDLILADYSLPAFDGLAALALARRWREQVPVIIVSGAIGEETAIEALKAGATDYVLKDRLGRLGLAVRRALQEAEELAARKSAEQQLQRQQAALRESEERLSLVVQSAKIGTWDWTIQVDKLVWFPRCLALFGLPLDAVMSYERFLEAVHPEDRGRVDATVRDCLEQRRADCDVESRTVWPDGSLHWIAVLGRAYYDEAGRPVRMSGAALDITDRKTMEEELRAAHRSAERAKAAAEEASRAKDRFLAVLSHELRTPLTPVLAAVSMLQKNPALDGRTADDLEMIRRNVELEARLIDDLLDLTRIARGKVELDKRPVELCTVIRRAAEVCGPDIKARQLHFGVDWGADRPYVVEADIARLQQVFWNLLKNSIKFTPHGGCVGIRCRPEGEQVVAEVNDSGMGIEPEVMLHIFDAFAQAAVARQFGGLGLGLAITKSLVELHGGTIEAHSEGRGQGATFTVRLPRIAASVPVSPRPAPPSRAKRVLRLLVVEDHSDTAEMLRLMLQMEGHQIELAGDVETALEKAGRLEFDLLISDLGLPDGSGLDLVRELRARGRHLPAIALSGYGQESDVQQSRAAGFVAHVTKPIDLDRLASVLADVSAGVAGTASPP